MALADFTPPEIVLHDSRGLAEIPSSEVRELVAALENLKIPTSIFENTAADLRNTSRGELSRAQARLASEGRLCDRVEVDGLAHIVPDAISTVSHIRRQRNKHAQLGEPTDATTAILLFVEACLRTALPRAFILHNVHFALTRPKNPSSESLARFLPYYTRATFAFVSLNNNIADCDEDEDSATSSDFRHIDSVTSWPSEPPRIPPSIRHAPDYGGTLEEWLKIHDTPDQSDQSSEPSEPITALSCDGHPVFQTELLAQHGSDKLCILVLAPQGRIVRALTSALYHRRTNGFSGPVLGIVVDPGSTTVELTIAWLDCMIVREGALPTVHMLHRSNDSRRLYDLHDLGSILLFGAALLSLSGTIKPHKSRLPLANDLHWRADSTIVSSTHVDGSHHERISAWIQGVEQVFHPTRNKNSICSPPIETPSVEQESDQAQSYSALAGRSSKNHSEPFWLWTHDRFVFTFMFPPPWISKVIDDRAISKAFRQHHFSILPFVNCYNDYIEISGRDLSFEIPTHPNPYIDRFCKRLQTFVGTISRNSPPNEHSRSTDGLASFLGEHCLDIMRVVAHARHAKAVSKHDSIPEAHYRIFFDLLLEVAFDDFEQTGVVTLHEKHLLMPCNAAHHKASPAFTGPDATPLSQLLVASELNECFESHEDLLIATETVYKTLESAPQRFDIPAKDASDIVRYSESASRAYVNQKRLDVSLTKGMLDFEALRSRSAGDPRSGKCDAVGVLKIAQVFPEDLTGRSGAFSVMQVLEKALDAGSTKSRYTEDTQDFPNIGLKHDDSRSIQDLFSSARSARKCNEKGLVLCSNAAVTGEGVDRMCHKLAETTFSPSSNVLDTELCQTSARSEPMELSVVAPTAVMDSRHRTSAPDDDTSPTDEPLIGDTLREPRHRHPENFNIETHASDLYVPVVVLEHKKQDSGNGEQSANRLRGFLTATCRFLASLKIYNFPVFGMLTEGTIVVVICGWTEEPKSDNAPLITRILERNAYSFDISDPRDALNFVIFLYRLSRVHAPQLRAKLEGRWEAIRNGQVDVEELKRWTQQYHYPRPRKSKEAE